MPVNASQTEPKLQQRSGEASVVMQLQLWPSAELVASERDLIALAVGLGALDVGPVSGAEKDLAKAAPKPSPDVVKRAAAQIRAGHDPLGAAFCSLRSPLERRGKGATYTPTAIVDAMVAWAKTQKAPSRIVDPGAGSGRFIVRAGRAFSSSRLVAIELDPVAALLARAHLANSGLGGRAEVHLADYRQAPIKRTGEPTLFIGNPPYVRHHDIDQRWKEWLSEQAAAFRLTASQLAGLHVHFFLATLLHATSGDLGCFITAAEWLDVNYGELVRKLFVGPLGGTGLHVIEPTAEPFPDAQTTAAITCFQVGSTPKSARVRRVSGLAELGNLGGGRLVRRERFVAAGRWTPLTHAPKKIPEGYVELGELCRVKRGQVTGANDFWIAGSHSDGLPSSVLFPTVTKARELYAAGKVLADTTKLRRVIDLPEDLDQFEGAEKKAINSLLAKARAAKVDKGYVARHRKAWWSVGLYEPAPILGTYMARRPPGFVRNLHNARNINVAHGIYPRERLPVSVLDALTAFLSTSISLNDGRTYAGGLTKFEPREMERLLVPTPDALAAGAC